MTAGRRGVWAGALGLLALAGAGAYAWSRPEPHGTSGERDGRSEGAPARGASREQERRAAPHGPARHAPIAACRHPYLPQVPGSVLRYVLRAGELSMTVTFVLEAEEPAGDGMLELSWGLDVAMPPEPARHARIRTRCDAAGAEPPWFPLQLRLAGLAPEQTFRLPRSLRAGTEVRGEAVFAMAGRRYELRRRARVAGQEDIVVGAGSFRALRLEVSDESRFEDQDAEQEGTEWLAPRVGLVRYEQRAAGAVSYELELVAVEDG